MVQFCSTYVCDRQESHRIDGGKRNDYYLSCNGIHDCNNTSVDEDWDCVSDTDEEKYQCKDNRSTSTISASKHCDNQCDCQFCDDESVCNNVQYGLTCLSNRSDKKGDYVTPAYLCDDIVECEDGSDEANCTMSGRSCVLPPSHPRYNHERNGVRYLSNLHTCAVPFRITVCVDGLDQVNCTDPGKVAMWCLNEGYNTTLSIFAICKGYSLCDDDYNNKCIEPEGGCLVHKNKLCDGEQDCLGGADESQNLCYPKRMSKVNCVRRLKGDEISHRILLDWVFDGEVDCIDGRDEDARYWKKCGTGSSVRYLEKGSTCQNQLRCPEGAKFIDFEELCDRLETCDRESEICSVSRNIPKIWDKLTRDSSPNLDKTMSLCMRGLEHLQAQLGGCKTVQTSNDKTGDISLIKTNTQVLLPVSKTDCQFVYGEMYVYLSCTDSCLLQTPCLLKEIPHDTCVNKIQERIFAVTVTNKLTVVLKRRVKTHEESMKESRYHNELYPCENKNCVLYSEVCNLADDCGDRSDEKNCTNHFYCPETEEYIPLTSKCDGKMDCRDYYDECNSDCDLSHQLILRNLMLRWLSLTVGALAILLNAFNMFTTGHEIIKVKTFEGLMNKSFIILISLGDFLMGIYLTYIAVIDFHKGSDYCRSKYVWLSSLQCSLLGVLSTIATQLSLFSMTCLSLFRLTTIDKIIPRSISARSILDNVLIILGIFTLSATIAYVPLVVALEDFFVNGLYYHGNPLFTGSVSKGQHYETFRSYFGHFKGVDVTWETIRLVVKSMFTAENGGML